LSFTRNPDWEQIVKIEIWSDIVCPWCYIGKRRLEAALKDFDGDVELVYRSFELDPSAPARADKPIVESLAAKYRIDLDRARQMLAQTTQAAAQEGLDFDFASAQSGNTFDAHRVLQFARTRGLQVELKERLMRAYFTEGRAFSHPDELAELAADVGLDPDEVRALLDGDDFAADVRGDESRARQIAVTGVPFFLIDEEIAISGAQPPATFLNALRHAETSRAAADGPACADGVCDVP
jgi:predicted DsbA family dithiol-disulfide isomerase